MYAPNPPRPCDRPLPKDRRTGPCDMCDETDCGTCLLAPAPEPGSPDLEQDRDPDVRESER